MKKFHAFLAAGLSAALLLSGCGGSSTASSSAAGSSPAGSATTNSTAADEVPEPIVTESPAPADEVSTAVGTPGLIYGSAHGGYEVTGYDGPEANVIIPDEYEGYPVVGIAERAFKEAEIDSVVFGKNISYMERNAFRRCKYLETVTLSAALTELDYEVFADCPKLRTVNIPSDSVLASIDNVVFHRCYSLESFTIPASCTYLGSGAFKECTSLTQVTFPDGWSGNIDGGCFEGCTAIRSIDIPAVESLGQNVFSGWTADQSIHFGCSLDGVKICHSGYVFDQDTVTKNGMTIYDYWFGECEAAYTTE